jgi:membrane-bound lytic murein transglycosylase D
MKIGTSLENSTITGCSRKNRLGYVGLWLALVFILIMVGCGGVRNNVRPIEQDQSHAIDEEQEGFDAGELNAKHLEELYAKSGIKDRDRSIEEELKKLSHQSGIDFPIEMNKQVRGYIAYFATERKGFTARSLARSSRYLPMIKEVFREYGLPEDLAYLAMVESGFNSNASSPAGACGMWQFIKGTGLRYGLVINGNVDERRDPEK